MKQEQQEKHKTESNYRYPGSRPFNDTNLDRSLFFGRDEEIQLLFHHILVENLFVLFSKSGMGKTSLLNAGLMQMLRERDFLPMSIRFNDPEISPLITVYTGIEEAVQQRNEQVDEQKKIDYETGELDSLWQYFKTAAFWIYDDVPLTPILIFDQFEEFFTLHEQEEREAFITQLADLVRGRVPKTVQNTFKSKSYEYFPYSSAAPKVKIVISIREDYLGHLEELSETIPGILKNRFRLLPLTRAQAMDAIINPAGLPGDDLVWTQGFSYVGEAVEEMLDFLCERREMGKTIKTDEVEPFQLQLLCHHIEEKVHQRTGNGADVYKVMPGDLGGKTGMKNVLQGFYEERLKVLSSVWERIKIRKLCEKRLIFKERRSSLQEGLIISKYKVPKALLSLLVDNRLLRCERRVESTYYELSHDTYVQPILESRRRRKIKQAWIGVPILAIIFIFTTIIGLNLIDKYFSINKLYEEAEIEKQLGNYSEAIDKYDEILEKDAKRVSLYMEIAGLYEQANNYDKAIEIYEKALKTRYKNKINEEIIHYRLGKIYADHKNELAKAVGSYKEAIEIDPEQAVFHIALGDVYGKQLKFIEAEDEYTEALELDDKNEAVYKGLAITYINQERFDKAIEFYRNAVNVSVDFAFIYRDIASEIQKKGMSGELGKLYQEASEVDSEEASFYKALGEDFNYLGKYDMAIENYKKALKLGDKNASTYSRLAILYINQGASANALRVYREAVDFSPDYAYIYGDIAKAMDKNEMKDELEDLYEEASKVEKKDSAYYENLGDAFLDLKDYDSAIDNYKKALKHGNKKASSYRRLAVLYVESGKPAEAINTYVDAVNFNTDYVKIIRNISWAMKNKRMAGDIKKLYQAASEVKTNEAEYYVKLAAAFSSLREYSRAIENLDKAIEKDPENASNWRQQGVAFRKAGKHKDAIRCYKKAIKYGSSNARTYNMLGVAYGRTENYKEAIKSYKNAIRSDPTYMTARVNLAEVTLAVGNTGEAFKMANELLKKKRISTVHKLAMRFISIASLIFQDKGTDTRRELERFIKYYKSLSNPRPGAYAVSRRFIKKSNLEEEKKDILLRLIVILESTKKAGNKILKELEPKIKEIFKDESTPAEVYDRE